ILIGHEVGAAMASDYNRATRVAHARGFIKIPPFHQAIDKSRRESITGPKHVIDLDGKTGHGHRRLATIENGRPFFAAFDDDCFWTKPLHRLHGCLEVTDNLSAGDLRVGHG